MKLLITILMTLPMLSTCTYTAKAVRVSVKGKKTYFSTSKENGCRNLRLNIIMKANH
jgi:hypothetical protein